MHWATVAPQLSPLQAASIELRVPPFGRHRRCDVALHLRETAVDETLWQLHGGEAKALAVGRCVFVALWDRCSELIHTVTGDMTSASSRRFLKDVFNQFTQ